MILISLQKDEETEESDEEEGQRGLEDFGFGSMYELLEMDEEKDALKLRRGDLDSIVNDLSDEEDDKDAAAKAAVAMEIAEDKPFPSFVSMFRLKIVHKDDIVN